MQLSKRVQQIKPSATLAVTQKAKALKAEGKDIIGLGAGEPDFDTPDYVKEAAKKAMDEGKTKYTPVEGLLSLREAISEKFSNFNKLEYAPDQILVSTGGKQCIFNLMLATINPGDEVIIPAPYWVSYPDMTRIAEGKPVIVEGGKENRFKITAEQLEAAITPKTRMFMLNSPSNPTGMAYTKEELVALAEVLKKHPEIIIATDDMYEYIMWDKKPFYNILMVAPELYEQTVVLSGVSKAYSMTGWRIGYAGGPKDVIAAMKKIQSQSTSNPSSISQAAAEAAIRGNQDFIENMVTAFKTRHDFVVDALNKMPGVECEPTDGTFYVFPSVEGVIQNLPGIKSDLDLAEFLLTQAGVAVVPGTAFGAPGFIRLSIATSQEALQNALERLNKAFGGQA